MSDQLKDVTVRQPTRSKQATGPLGHLRYRLQEEGGQSFVEFALVTPLLLILVLGIVKFGTTYNQYLTLTDSVRNGARQLAVERGQPAPCTDAMNEVTTAAGGLAGLTVQQPTFPAPDLSTCTNLVAGEAAKVSATVTCDLSVFGINFAPGCTLHASATERIE